MKPVLILQHQIDDGPGYLATWLHGRGVPMQCCSAAAGDARPESLDGFAGLAILGGAMSANDPLPYLRHEEDLVRQAIAAGLPVIGHCLGAQLMARALGARIGASRAPEIGWQPIEIDRHPFAQDWFGTPSNLTVFHWHYEAFELPAGATRLASSPACQNQAFSLGPHLGLQFHLEIDKAKITSWVGALDAGYPTALTRHPRTVQTTQAMLSGIAIELKAHQVLADRLYGRWLSACPR